MTNIDAQRIKEIRDNTKEMTYYMKSIAKSFERIADALEIKADIGRRKGVVKDDYRKNSN